MTLVVRGYSLEPSSHFPADALLEKPRDRFQYNVKKLQTTITRL